MMSAVHSTSKIDIFTELVMAKLKRAEAAIRMHCQFEDCYELSDVAETKTSLHYCRRHYHEKQDRLINWASLNLRDYHE